MEELKVKVKVKEYDEIKCRRCGFVMKIEATLKMYDGYRGGCTCPECNFVTVVHKVKPDDTDYNVDKEGIRTRKIPKVHMSKKQRRIVNKALRQAKV